MEEPAARPGAHKALVPLHLREDGTVLATRSLPTRDTDRGSNTFSSSTVTTTCREVLMEYFIEHDADLNVTADGDVAYDRLTDTTANLDLITEVDLDSVTTEIRS